MKKKELLIISAIIASALIIVLIYKLLPAKDATRQVHIFKGGELVATGVLGQTEDIVVAGADGEENIVSFTEDGVYMSHSTCKNQRCVEQGVVNLTNYKERVLGPQIICLPNQVIIELVLSEEEENVSRPDV